MKPIFIHSLFRTGSTYIWNKFRQDERYHCYYEPCHQNLIRMTLDNIESLLTSDFEIVNHPRLTRSYWEEYRPALQKNIIGLPNFKKEFSFDEFCTIEDNQPFKQYIDYLIKVAGEKQPLFQFNRSALRIQWFKKYYPQSVNIYLIRHPRDQWQSYHNLYKRTSFDVFYIQDLLLSSINANKEPFRPLARNIPLVEFHDDLFQREEQFYRIILESYDDHDRYLIFYYLWFRSMLENVLVADLVINMNRLTNSLEYRAEILKILRRLGADIAEFDDSDLKRYNSYSIPERVMTDIENKVQEITLQSLPPEEIDAFFLRLATGDQEYFSFHLTDFKKKHSVKTKTAPAQQKIKKLEKITSLLSKQFCQYVKEIENLKRILSWKDVKQKEWEQQLNEKESFIRGIDQKLANRDEEIHNQEQQLKQKEEQILEIDNLLNRKETELKLQEEQLLEKEQKIREIDHQLTKKEKDILNLHKELAEAEKEVHQKDRQLAQKDKEVLHLQLTLSEKDEQLNQLSFQLHQHLDKIKELDAQLHREEAKSQHLLNSMNYKLGKAVLWPLYSLRRLSRKLKPNRDTNNKEKK